MTKTRWWFQPLRKIWKSVGMIIPNIWKNKKCSKPPTRYLFGVLINVQSYNMVFSYYVMYPSLYICLCAVYTMNIYELCYKSHQQDIHGCYRISIQTGLIHPIFETKTCSRNRTHVICWQRMSISIICVSWKNADGKNQKKKLWFWKTSAMESMTPPCRWFPVWK